MTPPLVSVITPTYNHEAYIRECVDSVRAQTYADWEQIIVDDGSTDGTGEVVRQIIDRRISYARLPHRGVFRLAETYNEALNRSRGDLIAILEGDDFWPPGRLETLVPAFTDPDIVLAFGQTAMTMPEGEPTNFRIPEGGFVEQFGNSALFNTPVGAATRAMFFWPGYTYTFPTSVLIRRNALEAIGGFQYVPGLPFVDYQTFLTLSLRGRYFYTSQVTGYWRRHRRSATTHRRPDATEGALLEFMRAFLQANRAAIPFSGDDELVVNGILTRREHEIAIHRGRAALVETRWREARGHFRHAMKAKRLITWMKGAVGLMASFLHVNLEWLVEIRDRLFSRTAGWTGVYRIPRGAMPDAAMPRQAGIRRRGS